MTTLINKSGKLTVDLHEIGTSISSLLALYFKMLLVFPTS
uniref:Uncharacterized protein n=1 Tax=Rhizophora mucronata TaxID=61149 RepID=A0A2P2PW76_RHIMU